LFVAEAAARAAENLVDVNKSIVSYCFQRLRYVIYDHSEHLELLDGDGKADESYFGE